jgi:hypothetical protein
MTLDQEFRETMIGTLASIEGKLDNHIEKIEDHESTLFGNGKDGLKIRVDRLEQDHARWKKGFIFFQTIVSGILVWLGKEALT